jgi:hypothetical protein
VRLRRVKIKVSGEDDFFLTYEARDLFAYLRAHDRKLPKDGVLVWAKFGVRCTDSPRPRSVEIRAPQQAKYKRDDDSALIELWLKLRGFRIHDRERILAGA